MQTAIRPREPRDDETVARLIASAFGTDREAQLVDALRRDGDCACEFVAIDGDSGVMGHIFFSHLDVRAGAQQVRAVALAPLAVRADVQRNGIGGALIRTGLDHCTAMGWELAIVVGHPNYYARFGFSALLAKLLDAPYAGPSFMAQELAPGALSGRRWKVTYPRAFSNL